MEVKAPVSLGFGRGAAKPLAHERFKELHAEIIGRARGEKWIEIPWMIDLWAARKVRFRKANPFSAGP